MHTSKVFAFASLIVGAFAPPPKHFLNWVCTGQESDDIPDVCNNMCYGANCKGLPTQLYGTSLILAPVAVVAAMRAVVLHTLAAAETNATNIHTPRPATLIRLLRSAAVFLGIRTTARVKPFVNSTTPKAALTTLGSVETRAPIPSALPMLVVSAIVSPVPTAPMMAMSTRAAA